MSKRRDLERAIATLEAQRSSLGDDAVDAVLQGLRRQLAELEAAESQVWQTAVEQTAASERRIVTVLFCDVAGSTALAEKLDPETWADIMDEAFAYLTEPVDRYGGNVARLMGDAILAFFGAPKAHEDDPQRAILAGLAIIKNIQSYREQLRRERGMEFNVRVGINTGLVVAGKIGTKLHREYTALGDAVNLAARMEETAQPGTVQGAEHTYRLVASEFEFESVGAIEVKGKTARVQAYRVVGRKSKLEQPRGLASYGVSLPLVGREAEFAAVTAAVERLLGGQGGVLAINGEAGIGKSRLVAEWQRSSQSDHLTWLSGRTLSYGQSISYRPFQEILRQYCGFREDDGEVESWINLERNVRELFPDESAEILPYLASLMTLDTQGEYIERV